MQATHKLHPGIATVALTKVAKPTSAKTERCVQLA